MNIIIDNSDTIRLLTALFAFSSAYFSYISKDYSVTTKFLKILPRIYIALYYLFVVFDLYLQNVDISQFVMRGGGTAYGLLALLASEVYIQWANRKYGRR